MLALALSVTGNAAAAVIISSNAQVAAHTIAGAAGPSSLHHNLIAGSVGTADLASDARVHKIDFKVSGVPKNTTATYLKLDELTLSGGCNANNAVTTLSVIATTGAAGDISWAYNELSGSTTTPAAADVVVAAGAQPQVVALSSLTGGDTAVGEVIYRNAKRVITVPFHATANLAANGLCSVTGTAFAAAMK
jgi:hypothetical protein